LSFGCEAIVNILDAEYGARWSNYIPYESTLLSNFVIALLLMGMNGGRSSCFSQHQGQNAGARG